LQSVAVVVQPVLHADVPHWYAPQLAGDAAAQPPVPLQNEVAVNVAPVQLAAVQIVDVPGGAPHAVRDDPSHFAWHAPVPVHAVRDPCGVPERTWVQVPSLPETSHASHCPVHALLQHRPSTQCPLPHSESAAHVAPSGLLHVPSPFALQVRGAVQDATVQHTPSTQWLLVHCVSPVHEVPGAPVETQVVPLQK
jgi:hypothetical protein